MSIVARTETAQDNGEVKDGLGVFGHHMQFNQSKSCKAAWFDLHGATSRLQHIPKTSVQDASRHSHRYQSCIAESHDPANDFDRHGLRSCFESYFGLLVVLVA
jgi:hypothetical protein